MVELQLKLKKKSNVITADGTKTSLEYIPIGDYSKDVKLTVSNKDVADILHLPTTRPEDTVIILIDEQK